MTTARILARVLRSPTRWTALCGIYRNGRETSLCQQLHEVIREHSMEAAKVVKAEGLDNDLLIRLKNDPAFASVKDDFDTIVDPAKFVGRAPEQVADFLAEVVYPILEANADLLNSGVAVDKVNV